MRQQMFRVADFPTETKLKKHLAKSIEKLNDESDEEPTPLITTLGGVIKKYRADVLPELAKSTRGTDESMLAVHIEPKWATLPIADVRPLAVSKWIKTLPLSASSKGRAKRLLKQLIDFAMYADILPVSENPMKLVRVKGSTKRAKKIVLLTQAQVAALIDALAPPYSVMVTLAATLGLRVEELIALRWNDFDFAKRIVTIQRAFTHGEVRETKTPSSSSVLPIPKKLDDALTEYQKTSTSPWLFPSSRGDGPRWSGIILQDHIRPAAQKLDLPHFGWHSLRHSFRSWLGSGKATISQQKDLMRHAAVSTTMDVYGGADIEKLRTHVDRIAKNL